MTAFATFVDLRFDYGPIGLYAVIVVVEFAVGEKIAQKITDAADRQLAARSNEKAESAEQIEIEMAHIQDLRAADKAHEVEPNPLYHPEMVVNTHSDWKKKLRNSHIKSGAVAGFQGQDQDSTSADEQDANAANAARIKRARKARLAQNAKKQQSVGSDSDQPNASHLEKQQRLAKLKQQRSNVTKAQSKALKPTAEDVVIVDV